MQFQQPSAQAHYNLNQLIQHRSRHRTEYLQVLPSLQAEKLSSFLTRLLLRVHVESYIAGDSTYESMFYHCCNVETSQCLLSSPGHQPNLDLQVSLNFGNFWSKVTSQETKLKQWWTSLKMPCWMDRGWRQNLSCLLSRKRDELSG